MTPTENAVYFEANRQGWNKRTPVHVRSTMYDVDGFRAGKTSLNKIELQEVGNVKGKSLLHLQCHFGLDTLSWAREGATVTGVDISEEAIAQAKQLAAELGIAAEFVCSNIYQISDLLDRQFDVVFTSYGAICWLPDLQEWGQIISRFLKPGGIFYIVEFHPVVYMLDDEMQHLKYPYSSTQVIEEVQTGTYTDFSAPITYKEYTWNHGLGEVVNALATAGLRIEMLHEFPFSCYNCFRHLQQGEDGYWRIRGEEAVPIMFSLTAIK